MHVWLQAIALLTASKKGMSSNQLSRTLGVTLKTAWFMSHRIRMAMSAGGSRGPMGGAGKVVEVDETYFGKVENETDVRADGKPMKKKGRGTGGSLRNRRAVVALIERGGSARTFPRYCTLQTSLLNLGQRAASWPIKVTDNAG
jgi:hypothetical protein